MCWSNQMIARIKASLIKKSLDQRKLSIGFIFILSIYTRN